MPASSTQKESEFRATADLAHISQLNNSFAFTKYFLRRVRDKILATEAGILSGNLHQEEFAPMIARLVALREIERITEDDAAGARSVLGLSKEEMPCT